jgi:putative heme-binding domain-containing protein
MRAAREGGRKEPQLVLAIAQSGNLEEGARELTSAEIQQMVSTIAQKGDPARGERIFRRAELSCTVCHSIGGVGGKVGPDLTSIGASAPVDYLIESLLYPNRKVKEGYHSVVIETKDGQEFSGIPVRETTDQVVMRDISNREVAIAKNNIQNRTVGGSIMPSGLLENLNNEEQIDLYRFLSELGKPGPYDASRGNVARFWKLLPETIDIAQFGAEKVVNGGVDDSQWSPAFALVDGRLLRDELKAKLASIAYRDPASIYAAARFQVAKSGNVRMRLSDGKPLGVWIDGKTAAPGSEINADLASGAHTIVVKLDAKNLPDFVRLETDDGTFSSN